MSAKTPVARWTILLLLVLSVSINYIDRGNLSIAAPLLKDEMGISAAQLGLLLSAFFATYSVSQIAAGWLVDRFNVGYVLAVGFLIWSLATAVTALSRGFYMLICIRMLLGMGESVAFPSYSKILAAHFAEHQRGFANSLIDAGTKCGPALGTLIGGFLMARFGWRAFFAILGLGSLIWLPFWFKCMPPKLSNVSPEASGGPGIRDILGTRPAWATFAGLFCANYLWFFLLTWLPFYLVRERHYTMRQMAVLGSLAYAVTAFVTTATGWMSDRAIVAGATPTRVRKLCTSAGLGLATIVVAVGAIPNRSASMVVLLIACASYGVFASSHWAITQTLAGPLAAGKWTGLQASIGNLAGIVAPALTGFLVNKTGRFLWAFAFAAAASLIGSLVYGFLLEKVEPVQWRSGISGL